MDQRTHPYNPPAPDAPPRPHRAEGEVEDEARDADAPHVGHVDGEVAPVRVPRVLAGPALDADLGLVEAREVEEDS